jgi:fatty-acyl-CoA synthase
VNTFHGSDEMLDRIIRVGTDLSSVDPVGYARFNNALENVPEDAAKAGLNAIGLYGMSEVHALYSRRSLRPKERMSIPGGSLVSIEASARVVNPDTSKVLEIGEEGELQLRGPSLFAGYLADGGESIDSVLTSKHFDHDWFRTGDLARMEDEVTFEYLARLGDVLRLGGFLVNPAEIEECLLSQEGVDAVQVVGVDLPGGPKAVAFVVSEQSIDAQKLRNECRNRLASFKVPALIIQLQEFPTTESANGTKIQKVRLRDIAIEALTNN